MKHKKNMNTLIICNPVSGKGNGLKTALEVKEYLIEKQIETKLIKSFSKSDLQELVEDNCSNYDLIFACGGDGTFRDVMEVMQNGNWNSPLALIPGGSGNDFIKSLGTNLNIKDLVDYYLKSDEISVYTSRVNDLFMLNVLGVGIDTDIVSKTIFLKRFFGGGISYLLASLISIFFYKAKHYKIILDDKVISGEFYIIAICNGKYFGGGMKIAPNADIHEKKLSVMLLRKVNLFKIIKALSLIYSGKHIELDYVEEYFSEKVEIEISGKSEKIDLDGDLFEVSGIVVSKEKNKSMRLKKTI